jgi:hypothetical protein
LATTKRSDARSNLPAVGSLTKGSTALGLVDALNASGIWKVR